MKICEYAKKVDAMKSEDHETIRANLAELSEWMKDNYSALNHTEIRELQHELVDISA